MTPEPIQEELDENTLALQQAATLLAKAASDQANRSTILKEVESTLSRIKLIDFPDLAESPIIQGFIKAMGMGDLKPGETRARGTLAERTRDWEWIDLRQFRPVSFIPAETTPLTFNGLTIDVTANEEITVPSCFYDIYRDRQRALRNANLHEHWLMGRSNTPPDSNWLTPEGAIVRAHSKQGQHLGLVSGFLGVGPIDTTQIPQTPEGQS